MSKETSIEESATPTEFRTDQTPIAAYLIAEGFSLLDTETNLRGFTEFLFENNSKHLAECVKNYQSGNATVNPDTYIRIYQDLIKRIKRGW